MGSTIQTGFALPEIVEQLCASIEAMCHACGLDPAAIPWIAPNDQEMASIAEQLHTARRHFGLQAHSRNAAELAARIPVRRH